jgi:hypothetical protein
MAVGYGGTPRGTLAERWDGSSWSLTARAVPDSLNNTLHDVSCDAGVCLAVGFNAGMSRSVVERWDGSTWTYVAFPTPPGSTSDQLFGVSCIGPTQCTVVGSWEGSANDGHALAAQWNGETWTTTPAADAATQSTELVDVSCPSANRCVATAQGYQVVNGSAYQIAIESWNGVRWRIVSSSDTQANPYLIGSVSCGTPRSCVAVANDYDHDGTRAPVTLVSNGTAWSSTTGAYDGSEALGVNCAGRMNCVVSGIVQAPSAHGHDIAVSQFARRNGSEWITEPSANHHAQSNAPQSIDCTSTGRCFAVGQFGGAKGLYPLIYSDRR